MSSWGLFTWKWHDVNDRDISVAGTAVSLVTERIWGAYAQSCN